MADMPVVLITGASSGIGYACARRFSASGFRVFGAARRAPPPGAALAAGADGPRFLSMDVRDDQSVSRCVAQVLRDAGRIDVLVNNAGIVVGGSAEEMLTEEIRDQIETNLIGVMRTCKAVLPGMRGRGTGLIVNIGSIAGLMGLPFQSAYSASKYALEGYSEALQGEVRRYGIRVVIVEPGDVHTEITEHRTMTQGGAAESPYAADMASAMRSQEKSERNGWNVERVARFIERVIRSRSPRFRYKPGPLVERIAPAARRFLPDRLFLRIVAAFCGIR